jgi:hypothetical protein
MRTRVHRLGTRLLLPFSLAACGDATGPALDDVLAHRATWSARHLNDYVYDYQATGFFILWDGQQIKLEVRNGAVASAVIAATGQPVPGSPSEFPTVEALFDEAVEAARDHTLRAISFDPDLGYPRRMDLAGPPDASGSVLAIDLQPLP